MALQPPPLSPTPFPCSTAKYLQSGFAQVGLKVNEMPNEFQNEGWHGKLRAKCQNKSLRQMKWSKWNVVKIIEEITDCKLLKFKWLRLWT